MAEHAASAEQVDEAVKDTQKPARQVFSGIRPVFAVSVAIVVGLAGLTGWLGYRAYQAHEAQEQRNLFVQVARQAAINLTTISYTQADSDIQRILASATGTFHDDFQNRSQPFIDVVKHVQSTSEGTVADAALVSASGDQAEVIVAVSVKTSIAAEPDRDPRRWRLRMSVQQTADGPKVSDVEFVP